MLKKRIVACVVVKDGIAVQSIGFNKYLPIGKPEIVVEFLNNWGIDEIILSDISASIHYKTPDFELIKKISKKCFVPLTIAGGINSLDIMRTLMHCGADKLSINHAAIENPEIIPEAANVFGKQCVVLSIDGKKVANRYKVYDYYRKQSTEKDIFKWAKEVELLGAGEILINSVDQDGQKNGFDHELVKSVCENVSIPVIACGGAGNPKHFFNLF